MVTAAVQVPPAIPPSLSPGFMHVLCMISGFLHDPESVMDLTDNLNGLYFPKPTINKAVRETMPIKPPLYCGMRLPAMGSFRMAACKRSDAGVARSCGYREKTFSSVSGVGQIRRNC